jgi:hypothetical protein
MALPPSLVPPPDLQPALDRVYHPRRSTWSLEVGGLVFPVEELPDGAAERLAALGWSLGPAQLDHDEGVQRARAAAALLSRQAVTRLFVAASGGVKGRVYGAGALMTWLQAHHLPDHPHTGSAKRPDVCGVCGFTRGEAVNLLAEAMSQLRWMAGGTGGSYGSLATPARLALFLELLASLPPLAPTEAEVAAFEAVVAAADAHRGGSSKLVAKLTKAKLLRNKAQRKHLVEALGHCGVLSHEADHGFFDRNVPFWERQRRPAGMAESDPPLCFWRGGVYPPAIEAIRGAL